MLSRLVLMELNSKMKRHCTPVSTALFFTYFCVLSVSTFQYSEILVLGMKTCPHLDSCRLIQKHDFKQRNCQCDDQCAFYNDCCIDAPAPQSRTRTRQKCMPFGNFNLGAYVIAECPTDFAGSAELVRQCLNDDQSDPLLSAPVTDSKSGKTYLNRYCAQCNDASLDLTSWLIQVKCDTEMPHGDNNTLPELTYLSGVWTVQHERETYLCDLLFDKPQQLSVEPRLCRTNMTSKCAPRWRRLSYIRMCEAYMSVVRTMDRSVLYRNPHCALCNNESVENLECYTTPDPLPVQEDEEIEREGRKTPFSFTLLLDMNLSDGNLVGISQKPSEMCPSGEKYDPFFKKCRELVCAVPGYTLKNDKCVKS